MRMLPASILFLLALPFMSIAQESASPPGVASAQPELGKWWKNSEIVKKLQLSEKQVNQIEESFLNHRKWLVPLVGELKSRENQLNTLMQAERLDDEAILAQADLVASTRARLEKENASMMLSIRKALTGKQWKRLGEIQDLQIASSTLILTGDTFPNISGASDATTGYTSSGEKLYTVEDGIRAPAILYQPMPPYTEEARENRVEGILLLQLIIRKDGSVDSPKVLRGLGYGLDESAIRTITEEWRFQPGTLNGKPVNVMANVEVSFRLF
jgi:TonB family protein